jgi:LysM repeat protein
MRRVWWVSVGRVLGVTGVFAGAAIAHAQDEAGGDPGAGTNVTVDQVSPGSTTTVTVPGGYGQPTPFLPNPQGGDVNQHLPSSAGVSTDTSTSSDGFDLRRGSGAASTVHGGKNAAYVVSGQYVPDLHTAKRGDTLWDISKRYYGNPYQWPRIWSYNRQLQNPHWIYPGDHIRMKGGYGVKTVGPARRGAGVPPNAHFLNNVGYVLDGKHIEWGEIIGSPDDQMLLSEADEIYVRLYDKDEQDEGKSRESSRPDIKVGDLVTIFEPRKVKNLTPYPLVWIRGIAKVNRVNEKTGMVRARIVESMTIIERGAKIGPLRRQVEIVKPVRNDKTVEAKIVGSLYPYEFYGQGQYVFVDKGSDDGLEAGNRLFAVSRGDEWRLGLDNAGKMADDRAITEDDRKARVENTPSTDDPELYPAETYAELIVVRTRKKTATVFVTASIREIARGARVIAREGY